jgi:hypothetical protein
MARDLGSVQQSVKELATGQEKLARDVARLQAAEKDIRHKISVPPPQSAATPAPKPMPAMPPEQAPPQASAAPTPPAPPTQLRPPEPVR